MSSLIMIPLCAAAWVLTLVKLRSILLQGAQNRTGIALNLWAMLLFFSITLTFLVEEFAASFNAYTFPNLSMLISHSSILVTEYFGTVTSLGVIGVPASKRTIIWIRLLLAIVIIAL